MIAIIILKKYSWTKEDNIIDINIILLLKKKYYKIIVLIHPQIKNQIYNNSVLIYFHESLFFSWKKFEYFIAGKVNNNIYFCLTVEDISNGNKHAVIRAIDQKRTDLWMMRYEL